MSKLNELLQGICSDGIPFQKISECCVLEKGKTPIQKAIPGKYPLVVTTSERKTSNTFQFDRPSVCIPLVSSRGHGVASLNEIFYQEGQFALGNILCAVTPIDPTILSAKFLHIYLNYAKNTLLVSQMKGGANVSLSIDAIGRCKIPVPPLEIQREIVRILDSFTSLTVELSAELSARQKQYGFYREKLLNHKYQINYVPLGELAQFSYGYTEKAQDAGDTRFIRITDITDDGCLNPNGAKYITLSEDSKKYLLNRGDLLLARTGATYGKTLYMSTNEPAVYASFLIKISLDNTRLLNRFYWHFSKSQSYWNQAEKLVSKGGQQQFNANAVSRIIVPVPPLDVQQRIINVLDNFDAICSDLNIGLPAEISARQKQYEYYRDLLLSFKNIYNITDRQTDRQSIIKLLLYVNGFAWVTLDEISQNCDNLRKPITSGKRESGAYPYYGASGIVDYVKDFIFDGDYLLISEDGANLLTRNTPIAFSISGRNWVNNHAHVLKFDTYELRRYVEFYLNSIDLSSYISGGAQPKLNQKNLNRIPIPMPAPSECKRIVSILDRFDTLCNDLSTGLPAEIAARQQQYEYYRDKLLTFKEMK